MSDKTVLLNPPAATDEDKLRERFEKLAVQWREETKYLSCSTEIAMHPAYQQIIGMGPAALPFILRELEQKPYHWYWALMCITGADPVPQEYKGQRQKMREFWLQWAKEQ